MLKKKTNLVPRMLKHRRKTARRKTGGAEVELEKVTLGRVELPKMKITINDWINVPLPLQKRFSKRSFFRPALSSSS